MKDSLLLLMTPNMSLEKWNELGQLSREINYYRLLCRTAKLHLYIYSYGRNDQGFIKNEENITVLCMPRWIPEGIPYKLQNFIYQISSLFIYKKYFKKTRLAKTNQFQASFWGIILKIVFKIPLVVRMGFYHSHFKKLSFFAGVGERIAFSVCDLILTTSSEARDYIAEKYNISRKKILFMCNTIDLNAFKPLNSIKEFDLIFVGRLDKIKNIEMMLEVIERSNLKTLIIGKGPLANSVANLSEKTSHIFWKERVDNSDLPIYYNKAKCLLIFSQYEGNPKALLEAMACGIPGIGTSVHGIRECIISGVNGILANPNPKDLLDAVMLAFENESKLNRLGENARQWTNIHCDMATNIEKEINFYAEFLPSRQLAY